MNFETIGRWGVKGSRRSLVEDSEALVEEFEVTARRRSSLHLAVVFALKRRRVSWRQRERCELGWRRHDLAGTIFTDEQRLQPVVTRVDAVHKLNSYRHGVTIRRNHPTNQPINQCIQQSCNAITQLHRTINQSLIVWQCVRREWFTKPSCLCT